MTRFFRLSGGGNDFLAMAEPRTSPTGSEIRDICRRGLSAGADGFFTLERAVSMQYFNANGNPAELCLNGTRCAVQLARHLGWGGETVAIETGAGTLVGRSIDMASVALDLPRPATPTEHPVTQDGEVYSGWRLEVGVPHYVIPWARTLSDAPVTELGPSLRRHPDWGERGSNVNFVRYLGPHRFEIRTFERGVEAETLACGTGVMASTAGGLTLGALELPVCALTLGGFELGITETGSDDAELWSLVGDARLIAEGTLHPGAQTLPPPADWAP